MSKSRQVSANASFHLLHVLGVPFDSKLGLSCFSVKILSELIDFLVLHHSPENVSSRMLLERLVVLLVKVKSVRVGLDILVLNVDFLHGFYYFTV